MLGSFQLILQEASLLNAKLQCQLMMAKCEGDNAICGINSDRVACMLNVFRLTGVNGQNSNLFMIPGRGKSFVIIDYS